MGAKGGDCEAYVKGVLRRRELDTTPSAAYSLAPLACGPTSLSVAWSQRTLVFGIGARWISVRHRFGSASIIVTE
jgi:hypothetical protein